MAKKAKTVFTLPASQETSVPALCAALDRKFGSAGFSFAPQRVICELPEGGEHAVPAIAITADGPWHKPGNERPAHGTMNAYAEGYAAALEDMRPKSTDEPCSQVEDTVASGTDILEKISTACRF